MNEKLYEIIESNGFSVSSDGDCFTELEFYSDKGEDVIITVQHDNTERGFIEGLYEWWEDFDPEEHAVSWYNVKDTVYGVPQSIRALLDDADSIDENVEKLLNDLYKYIEDGEQNEML